MKIQNGSRIMTYQHAAVFSIEWNLGALWENILDIAIHRYPRYDVCIQIEVYYLIDL